MKSARFEDVYELSPMQQGILFHTLYDPVGDLYFEQCVVTVRGALDKARFAQAWQRVAARHAILRTSFHWEGLEKPVQVVHPDAIVPMESRDWRGIAPETQRERLDAFLQEDRRRSFDLATAPLLRVTLLRTAAELHECVLSFQHLLLDRWSRFLVLNEVFVEYAGGEGGAALPSPRPYGEYIGWLQEQDRGTAEAFWRSALAGFTTPISLAPDRQPGRASGVVFEEASLRLSEELTSNLQSFARRNRLTLNTLVQGAWAILSSRYSGEEDILFGAAVSGRPASVPDVESMVGLFINTLPVRIRVPAGERIGSWLRSLQTRLLELRQYEYSSLVDIQGWSEVPRETPLFESLVVFENVGGDSGSLSAAGPLEVLGVRSVGGATSYPLTLLALPGPPMSFRILADRTLFERDALLRMLGHLQTLLEGISSDPERSLSSLPLLTERERIQLLVEWNRTEKDSAPARTLHQLFEDQAERSPEAVAAICGQEQWTYGQLNERASRLAHRLRTLGVRADVPVGICVARSLEMIVGVLGILKAGGACLPLDPEYPGERLRLILEDSGPPVLLTDARREAALPAHSAFRILLDADEKPPEEQSAGDSLGGVAPESLAYVLYTSGSTGKPKGVAMGHAALVNLVRWQIASWEAAAPARTLQFASLNFDVSFQEIFSTLSSGGTLLIASEELRRDSDELVRFLAAERVARLFLPFVALQQLAEARRRIGPVPLALREVITAGEQLRITPEIVELFEGLEGCSLLNHYGPTETHVVTSFVLAGAPSGWPALPPIGRPIDNAQIYLLDRHRQLVPVGVVGELYVGGAPLARGYWKSPERTEERFVPNPFMEAGARLYRTGDLARYREDGNLEFLGRADNQVKIRGFRVEPGEVEAILEEHPDVRAAVVVAQEETPGDTRLVAYVVPAGPERPGAAELRAFLKQKLPEYMMPAAFVTVSALPLTPSGKVDRRALPAPERRRPKEEPYTPPRTPVEETLAEIWKEILKVDRVGVEDNFFDLGGHSLLATRLVSRVAESFNLRLPLRQVFEEPRLEGLALAISNSLAETGQSGSILEMLAEVRGLSDEEAHARLLSEGHSEGEGPARRPS